MARKKREDIWGEPRHRRRKVGVSAGVLADALALAKGERTVYEVYERFEEKHEFGVTYRQEMGYGRSLRRALSQLYRRGQIDEGDLEGARLDIRDYLRDREPMEEAYTEDY